MVTRYTFRNHPDGDNRVHASSTGPWIWYEDYLNATEAATVVCTETVAAFDDIKTEYNLLQAKYDRLVAASRNALEELKPIVHEAIKDCYGAALRKPLEAMDSLEEALGGITS